MSGTALGVPGVLLILGILHCFCCVLSLANLAGTVPAKCCIYVGEAICVYQMLGARNLYIQVAAFQKEKAEKKELLVDANLAKENKKILQEKEALTLILEEQRKNVERQKNEMDDLKAKLETFTSDHAKEIQIPVKKNQFFENEDSHLKQKNNNEGTQSALRRAFSSPSLEAYPTGRERALTLCGKGSEKPSFVEKGQTLSIVRLEGREEGAKHGMVEQLAIEADKNETLRRKIAELEKTVWCNQTNRGEVG